MDACEFNFAPECRGSLVVQHAAERLPLAGVPISLGVEVITTLLGGVLSITWGNSGRRRCARIGTTAFLPHCYLALAHYWSWLADVAKVTPFQDGCW